VLDAAVRQRNMRVHLVAALLVGLAGGGLRLGVAEELALLLCAFLVVAAEVLNTGLEALVDLYTQEIDPKARVAKDAAAGMVLVLAAGALLVFTAVVARAWPQIAAEPGRIASFAALAVPLGAIGATLVAGVGGRGVVAASAVLGGGLLAALLPRFGSVAFGALAVVAYVLCAATGLARARRGAVPPAGEGRPGVG
jgi:diacylglycerol kinase (ATP)